ncbi:KAP family NTPase [Burkholderia multivorans]|uniref:KAP family NTPase n=1 Tax=Burkholderia multivorans TaxID=87883 RepID=UPI001C26DEE4|nr:KAP family NTPase [Burkholderia multivorans]MBU9344071.1 KAP family NTPase [Burkholderia multivorans]
MSRTDTKDDLLYYLNDDKVPVIALKGSWGTGKTFLWEEVQRERNPANEKIPLYASCFGLGSLDDLKQTLFRNSLGNAESVVSTARKTYSAAKGAIEKVAGKLIPGAEGVTAIVGSIGGLLQSVVVEKTLQDRLIVLDDIERRGTSLKIDALLGFIDSLKRNNCKVLLILNEEPLTEALSADWSTLKEKCVDREISLVTAPAEAAALGLSPQTPFRQPIVDSLERLGVTNIRVVQRIDRIVGTVFQGTSTLHDTVAQSLVPAVVLLTALNFKAVPKGPDVGTLLSEWRAWCAHPSLTGKEGDQIADETAFAMNFKLTYDVEFLDLVQTHLLTGQRLREKFENLIKARERRAAENDVENAAVRYIEATYLDPSMTDQDFVATAQKFAAQWDKLSADKISAIAIDLAKRGAHKLANEIAEKWAVRWRTNPKLWDSSLYSADAFFPVIRDALVDGNRQLSIDPSLLEAVLKVSGNGWSRRHERVINDATVDDMIEAIHALNRDNFALFVFFYRSQLKDPITRDGEPLFAKGVAVFVEAARTIKAEGRHSRLAELLVMHVGEHLQLSSETSEAVTAESSAPDS